MEFGIDKKQNPFRLQNEMSRFFWNQVAPALEKVFDELSADNELIRIESLFIDLGELSQEVLLSGKDLPYIYEKVLLQVREAIRNAAERKIFERRSNVTEQWIFYMQNGYLNWNHVKPDENWYRKVLEEFATGFASVTELRKLIGGDGVALQRIILQHNEIYLRQLVEILTAEKQSALTDFIIDLLLLFNEMGKKFNRPFAVTGELKRNIWRKVLKSAAQRNTQKGSNLFLEELVQQLIARNHNENEWYNLISGMSPQVPVLRELLIDKIGDTAGHRPLVKNKKEEAELLIKSAEEFIEETKIQEDKEPDKNIDEGIYVQFAGLILLHPFLAMFFSRLDLVREGQFIDRNSHEKALYLLYYLATGSDHPEEYELILPKILLSFPLYEPVIKDIKVNEEEKEEAEQLLREAIQKWTILKNTSPAGLRDGFLQRKGKYYSKDDKLFLQVETASIDMLLDHLPWNLSIVKLPWSKELLRVEWR